MSNQTRKLSELVDVLEDGRQFYEEASEKAEHPEMRSMFTRMARIKGVIASDLKTQVVLDGSKPSSGSLSGSIRKQYAALRARLAKDTDAEYVAQLEEFEDRILEAFEEQAREADDPTVRSLATKYLDQVRHHHDEMRSLKQTMGHG